MPIVPNTAYTSAIIKGMSAAKDRLRQQIEKLSDHEAANARLVIDDESARSRTAHLPERWQRFDSGRLVGDIVAALDRSRQGR
jgi:hypothetical protein